MGYSRNQQVVGADQLPRASKVGTNFAVTFRGRVIERQTRPVAEGCVHTYEFTAWVHG
jgi:hypothetical protein